MNDSLEITDEQKAKYNRMNAIQVMMALPGDRTLDETLQGAAKIYRYVETGDLSEPSPESQH